MTDKEKVTQEQLDQIKHVRDQHLAKGNTDLAKDTTELIKRLDVSE